MKSVFLAVACIVVALTCQAAEPVQPATSTAPVAETLVEAGPTIVIELKELGTDRAVAGVKLGSAFNNREPITPGVSDDHGRALLPIPAGEVFALLVETVAGEGWVPMQWYWSDRRTTEPRPDKVVIVMEKAVVFTGQVRDDAAAPVARASIQVRASKQYSERQQAKLARVYVKSIADGTWSCPFVPEGARAIDLSVSHPQYLSDGAAAKHRSDSVTALRDNPVTLRLERGIIVEGVVRGPDGQPIWKAAVRSGGKRTSSTSAPDQKTDKQGRFTCAVKPGATAVIRVLAEGFAPALKQFVVTEKPEPLTFDLVPGKDLAGRVVNEQGQALTNAIVLVDTWRDLPVLSVSLRVDGDGRFVWKDAPADAVGGRVFRPGAGSSQKVTLKAGEKNEIVLVGPTVVKGTVVDDETEAPVPEFSFSIANITDAQRPLQWIRRGTDLSTGKEGKFETMFTGGAPQGAIRIEADGYVAESSAPFEVDGKSKNLTFRMAKRELLKGLVRDSTGVPLAGADVVIITKTSEVQTENGRVPEFLLRHTVHTVSASNGTFRLPLQTDGYVLLVLHDAGYATVAGLTNSAVTLTPWGTIHGVAKTGTKPAARQALRLEYVNRVTPDAYHNAETDEKGSFRFERVMAGEVGVLTADKAGVAGRPLTKVKVEPGRTTEVSLKTD